MNPYGDTLVTGLDQLGFLIGRVTEDDLGKPTPCADWTVADLLDHTVASVRNFAVAATGGEPDFGATPPHHADVTAASAAYADAASDLQAAWRAAPADADPRSNTAEVAVHGWDLAQALGVSTSQLDDAVAQDGLDFMSANLTPENRGPVFDPELPAPEGAGAYERLAAFAGRRPLG